MPPLRASVNLVPLCCGPAFDSIPRLNLRADRQEPLPMFRCPGLPDFPSSALISNLVYFKPVDHRAGGGGSLGPPPRE